MKLLFTKKQAISLDVYLVKSGAADTISLSQSEESNLLIIAHRLGGLRYYFIVPSISRV